ncbi:ATPase involved in DNA repair [Symmachiella dynata]|uniref:ATPase involved in DNA repair n=1 Tax=Symmachiella dynata TaxID=2527995 RepID=A0A517ZLW6_9PLAN|nr:DNA repair ATPase [Symmachiella dynata]QDU43415.1 ATPase involved in DNA repair [Symmachiella dynata]
MAQAELENTADEAEPAVELQGGTYEIIRNRLTTHGQDLRARLNQLNEARKTVFGSIDTVLTSTERITTVHNCVPRDMVAAGQRFLFGYNVHFGLKTERNLSDVFAAYEFKEGTFHEISLDLIGDPQFEKDFQDVYRYYKNAVFAKFFVRGPHLYMIFRVGKGVGDIKTFKWVIQGEELVYVDNRSDHEVRYPPQHEFEWTRTHRDLHQTGRHPHISIDDRIFVETIGGDLTIKVENNTDSGEGIYAEPVDDPDQTLDDAEIHYALVGNVILLKIRPYQETAFRYFVYNDKLKQAQRLDSLEYACVLLPDDHGLIFADGYYLQTGLCKTFGSNLSDMVFERRIAATNGEDYLYVFYNRLAGVYVLLQYNLIEQRVETPVICSGFTFFPSGEMVCFKAQEEPQKHHAVQIWQTPYVDEDFAPPAQTDSYLFKIGNKDVVRGMAECHELLELIEKEDTYANLYVDIVKESTGVLDSYFWIDQPETFELKEPLTKIRDAAGAAIDEFDKVLRVKQDTAQQTKRVREKTREIVSAVGRKRFDHINDFVGSLRDLRSVRGDIISLRDLRYVDEPLIESLETEVSEEADKLAQRCVTFLLDPAALTPYEQKVADEQAKIGELTKVADAKVVEEEIAKSAAELEMLIEIVSNLKIDDATQRTAIIDNISAIFSTVNAARAALKNKSHELLSVEGIAEFGSQMKLLNQGVVNYLDICDSPDKCEEFLTKVMIQIEELEGRFAEFDEFVLQLTEKREEIYNAFETRKLSLVEARNKRAGALANAADRILKGIKTRVESLESINDINGYFASDLMIEKVRDIVKQLQELDDSVKVDDIQSRLKTVKEDAVRQLKDRQELFVDGANIIKLGGHQFTVNVQALDLTTVLRDGEMNLHLTGTNFFEPIENEELIATRDVWDQEVVSENQSVYRGEYLTYKILRSLSQPGAEPSMEDVRQYDADQLTAFVQRFMGPRYGEAYVKGVHDHDAVKLVADLLEMESTIGLLRYHTRARALALVVWQHFVDKKQKTLLTAKLKGFGTITQLFPATVAQAQYVAELQNVLQAATAEVDLFSETFLPSAAEYLFHVLVGDGFAISPQAADLFRRFEEHLHHNGFSDKFAASLKGVHREPASAFSLARDWVGAFIEQQDEAAAEDYVDEVAGLLLEGKLNDRQIVNASVTRDVAGLLGTHAAIQEGGYHLSYGDFTQKLAEYDRQVVPRFNSYVQLKRDIVETARDEMKLEEFRPRVLTSFVRNRLLDEVYLPVIGDNFAKQIGAAGEGKRTDRMGLLLLVSPPGYGKTTLMEYVANRLGVIFMKINGPAIGHQVTSLDPDEAPNAGAREEVEKLNLALEMGDNVMIYLDDIQHCNPEFLQKFISLCDATRKIEGVYKGRTRTYDLRGRKVAVVMAGNPYTESGEKFQIPDMLSNRADIYNLGEIIGEHAASFEMSYLENCLTSNSVLNHLATRSQKDVYAVIRMAERDSAEGVELEGNYSSAELGEMVATMKKLMRVRDVILAVNREYIRSAAQSDDYRTEPAFKLQGSYRNMNRIAEKVVPVMNDDELQALIVSNYENDSQTLTSDAEANMLKFKELMGILNEDEAQRWESIKRSFQQNVKLKGVAPDDKIGQVIMQMGSFTDGLESIRRAMTDGMAAMAEEDDDSAVLEGHVTQLVAQISGLREGLDAIHGSLADGIPALVTAAQAAERVTPAPIAEVEPPPQQPEPESQVTKIPAPEVVDAPFDQQQDDEEPATTGDNRHKITVVNKMPRSIYNVLQQQFELMNSWMKPLLDASNSQSADIKTLRSQLHQCLKDYKQMLRRIERREDG